jgi:hypothetical protein
MAKLTLSVDDAVIQAVKKWARARGLSFSQMVSTFFVSVTRSKQPPDEMPPVLKKLADILEKEDRLAEDYYDHVGRKYL